MEYRSPLGCNFKLEKSLSAVREESKKETPQKDEHFPVESSSSRKQYAFGNKRSSGNQRNSYQDNSPGWQRNSNNWKSPSNRYSNQRDEAVPISQYYHPSMLEDPWEELERNLK